MIRPIIGLLVLGILPLAAQTSSLQGVVTDPQGANVPAAIVTITNTDTSVSRKEVSDEAGSYKFFEVVPGTYKLEIQKPGFTTKVSSVLLQVDLPVTLNLALEVGKTSDVVNVSAETTTINTENATTGNPFTEVQIETLPLQTRNVVALMSLQAGVTSGGNVVGSQSGQNYVTVDGADVNGFTGTGGFSSSIPIPLDSVQEFRTVVSGEGADLGRGSGGQAQVVTKSGTNQFHGGLYEFNRNTDFEANDFFSNKNGVARPALIRNQYGGTIGGPIKKNKLFFFYNFEGRKDRSAGTKKDVVPSDTLRQGIVQVALKSGQTIQLSPTDVKNLDPLGIGENPYVISQMQNFPHGNDPSAASDRGLNFNDLLFNAPAPYNDHTQVGKLDYTLNSKMTFSLRGTLDGNSTAAAPNYPGQGPASESLGNPRGLAARYTYVISPSIVNAFNYGYTRSSSSSTGNLAVVPTYGFTALQATPRASQAFSPVQSYNDDLTWNKGRHTIQVGASWRHAETVNYSYGNEPSFGFSTSVLLGLGNDITADVQNYIQKTVPGAALANNANVENAFGTIFGMINSGGASYNYNLNGTAIPFGSPIKRSFATSSPDLYAMDSWKVKQNLTITYGLRYSIYGVPYETDGVQVIPTVPINEYFAQRQAAATYGVPNWSTPDANITYKIAGPVNNGPGYYPTSYNNLAPRFGFAYQPKGALEKALGKGSVLRGSYGIIYDNYGNDLASSLASGGTPGLITSVQQIVNTNYSTAPRYDGTLNTVAAIPAPVVGTSFPYTPPVVQGGFTKFTEVSADLKAPYEHVISANYARPLPKHMSIEVGYAGRFSHRGLQSSDYGQPLSQFTDPKSGQSWMQAAGILATLHDTGLTPAQVKANPGLVPLQPFIEDMLPTAAKNFLPGASNTAAVFYEAFQQFAGSWLDTLNEMDRIHVNGGVVNGPTGCVIITGCNSVFTTQASDVIVTTNSAQAAYNAALISIRRTQTHGWGYDFNYTYSHAIDNGVGGALQNAFQPLQGLGPAGFDMRHQINANFVVDVPVGKGKALFGNMPAWADQIVGGWQVSDIYTFRTGSPTNCSSSNMYNVNYLNSALCVLYPGLTQQPARSFGVDQTGTFNEYANTNVASEFVPSLPGVAGYNGIARGLSFWTDDMAINKNFRLPKENIKATLRIEAYNVFNKQEFSSSSMSIQQLVGTTPQGYPSNFGNSQFGQITSSASTPRVLQAVLRLSF